MQSLEKSLVRRFFRFFVFFKAFWNKSGPIFGFFVIFCVGCTDFLSKRSLGAEFLSKANLEIPSSIPYVRLESPSGAIWEWNEPSETDSVICKAVEFAHVVTQGRNIAEANLDVQGSSANAWMNIAQCFAGPPETPPSVGKRGWD